MPGAVFCAYCGDSISCKEQTKQSILTFVKYLPWYSLFWHILYVIYANDVCTDNVIKDILHSFLPLVTISIVSQIRYNFC